MADWRDRQFTHLDKLVRDHVRNVEEVMLRSKERQAEDAAFAEECDRRLAWLESKQCWTLDYDEARKEHVIPEGWPPGFVRKAQTEATPADEPKDETPPDTMMHRMLREKSGR